MKQASIIYQWIQNWEYYNMLPLNSLPRHHYDLERAIFKVKLRKLHVWAKRNTSEVYHAWNINNCDTSSMYHVIRVQIWHRTNVSRVMVTMYYRINFGLIIKGHQKHDILWNWKQYNEIHLEVHVQRNELVSITVTWWLPVVRRIAKMSVSSA